MDTSIHRVHPLAKLLVTVAFLVAVSSFGRYDISGLLTFFFYPVTIFVLSEIPAASILKRLLLISPLIVGMGILNPLFERQTFILGGVVLSTGWITFLSILIKGALTVTAALLLVATTGMDRLARALRMLGVPRIFVLQLLLTYRYISVLTEEVARMQRAYALRAPGQRGVHTRAWGSFAGQLILRSFDRAQRVWQAMRARGFTGDYNIGEDTRFKFRDFAYLSGWIFFFAVARIFDVPGFIGSIMTWLAKH